MELKAPRLCSTETTFVFAAQTLHQEMNQGGRGSIQLPALATNSLAEAPPVSLLIKDLSSFTHINPCCLCSRVAPRQGPLQLGSSADLQTPCWTESWRSWPPSSLVTQGWIRNLQHCTNSPRFFEGQLENVHFQVIFEEMCWGVPFFQRWNPEQRAVGGHGWRCDAADPGEPGGWDSSSEVKHLDTHLKRPVGEQHRGDTGVCLFLSSQGDETSTARSTPPPPPVWQKPEARRTAPKQAVSPARLLETAAPGKRSRLLRLDSRVLIAAQR